ncbi:alpha/beta fold hydrolase [Paraburkholderia sp. ZP32-5]|uniref:alpha/beta fold hydrolase n=1 Tax=Paraburkholderia sp. ZP32-5 TaxID=2883245 RepID=UPI001F2E4C4A|nr:alpha/beta hydrolase [Paraburkholderia sp. ZP32-5]
MNPGNVNVVLAHGAWADGSSWSKVIDQLSAQGIRAIAAPLPLTSLADDVAALEQTLERIDGPVVLAGHAYAGAVIGAARSDAIEALVFIAALAPDEGETVGDVFYRGEQHSQAPKLAPDRHGRIWLAEPDFAAAFAQDATPQELAVLAAVQRPISVACIGEAVGRPGWRDTPSWYLIAEQDRMIDPNTQHFMADRMNAHLHSHQVDHTPLVTAPQIVTNVIVDAVHAISAR